LQKKSRNKIPDICIYFTAACAVPLVIVPITIACAKLARRIQDNASSTASGASAITLFEDVAAQQKSASLMAALDRINRRMGSGTMLLLGEGVRKNWAMRRGNVSQRYTTEWDELAVAR
jgi:hypothetical protein